MVATSLTRTDTAVEIQRRQQDAWRWMGAPARAEQALVMSEEIRQVSMNGIASRHPEYSQRQVRMALMRLLHGSDVARAIWPNELPVAP